MAIVIINGISYDSTNAHHRNRAKFVHDVEIDLRGNVLARTLNGLSISTPGTISSGPVIPSVDVNNLVSDIYDSIQATLDAAQNVAHNNVVGGSVRQTVISADGSTVSNVSMNNAVAGDVTQSVVNIRGGQVNGVVTGVNRGVINHTSAPRPSNQVVVLPILRRWFKVYVANIDWSHASIQTLMTVFGQLWQVQAVAKPDYELANLLREMIVYAHAGDFPIGHYTDMVQAVGERYLAHRIPMVESGAKADQCLWDANHPAVRAILTINGLV